MTKRIEWLDVAKGIAIILMVLGHSSIPNVLSNFIFAFHMPLFFIASGMLTNWEKYNIYEFAIAKSKSLLIPFCMYSAIVLLIQMSMGWLSFGEWIENGWVAYALWFIPVLFLALLCNRLLYAIPNVYMRCAVLTLLLSLGIWLSHEKILLPWSLSSVPYATLMVYVGSTMKRLWKNPCNLMGGVILLSIVTFAISFFWRLDTCFNRISPLIPLTIGALSGTMMVFGISIRIEKHFPQITKFFSAIGKETYIVVAFSQIIIMLLNQYFSVNAAVKYGIMVILLICFKYMKDYINKLLKRHIF